MGLVSPAAAGTRYMTGTPDLSAAISGTNEFSPDDDVAISIVLQNSALSSYKFVQSGIVDRDDLPSTAKFVTMTLLSGNAPLAIKSDPQMVGDLKGGASLIAKFNTKIDHDAPAGTYSLPLEIRYTYLWEADQAGLDSIQYNYRSANETLAIPIRIKPELRISILSVNVDHLNAGTEGYLTALVKNTGTENGKKAVIKISQNTKSPVIPTEGSVYIGDFPMNATVHAQFRVSASGSADKKTYPLDVL
jgi:hypothetical protein